MNISYTRLADATCPRYYYYRYVEGLLPVAEKPQLKFGELFHKALGDLYTTKNLDVAKKHFEELEEGKDKAVELLDCYYRNFFQKENWEDIQGEVGLNINVPIKDGVLRVDNIHLTGKIDRYGKFNGVPAIMEWKTTAHPTMFVAKPNPQFTLYTLACRALGLDVKMVIYTVFNTGIKTSKNGIYRTKDGSERMIIDREYVEIEDWEIEEVISDLAYKVNELLTYEEVGYWPKSFSLCRTYGGCIYKDLCASSKEEREVLKQISYKKEEKR